MKQLIIIVVVIAFVGIGAYFLVKGTSINTTVTPNPTPTTEKAPEPTPSQAVATPTPALPSPEVQKETVIGKSAGGRNIIAYHYGTGSKELLFIGGIHGGYEWNTALVAYELMDYLDAHPDVIPSSVKVTVIPALNPDGLFTVTGAEGRFTAEQVPTSLAATVPGRYNANKVDLNRNFDCDWKASAVWQNTPVSGGTSAFSEPEAQAIRDYLQKDTPTAAVVWYSAAGGIYASNCHNGVLPETDALTKLYANASGYTANESFDYYAITGDMVNWFAKENIPAISVLLTNHTDTEWDKNLLGIEAVLNHYAK